MARIAPGWFLFVLPACMAVAAVCSSHVKAQVPLPIGGVYIDAEGVLRNKAAVNPNRFNAVQRRAAGAHGKGTLCYVSLPRLFAQVKAKLAAGQPIPDDMRFLSGMTKLRYVFVFPEDGDLVIAGEAEKFPARHQGRPLGMKTGRPVLRLDDLVTAIRTVGPGGKSRAFGCSIDLTNQQLQNMVDEAKRWGAIRASQRRAMAAGLAKAVGPQDVRFIGVEPNTMFAYVCVEADYLLKRLSLGLDKSPVPQVRSALSMSESGEGLYRRYWFEPKYEALLVSTDGNAYEIRGQGLQVKTTGSIEQNAVKAGPGATKFATSFTEHFEALAQHISVFADLQNVTDLAILAALIKEDSLHSKAKWDIAWLLESSGYPVQPLTVPRKANSLVNYIPRSGRVSFGVGGVMISPSQMISTDRRQKDEAGTLKKITTRPATESWTQTAK